MSADRVGVRVRIATSAGDRVLNVRGMVPVPGVSAEDAVRLSREVQDVVVSEEEYDRIGRAIGAVPPEGVGYSLPSWRECSPEAPCFLEGCPRCRTFPSGSGG